MDQSKLQVLILELGEAIHVGQGSTQPKEVEIRVEEMSMSALMMLSRNAMQHALQVILDDQLMMQVENSLPRMTKSMSIEEEEGGR